MPALKGKRNQLTAKEVTKSRFVTKIRWSVKSVHGIIKKKYRLLNHIIDSKPLPNVELYFRIPAFLHNQFGKALKSDAHLSEEIIRRMKHHLHVENTLTDEAKEKGWFRKKLTFQSFSSNDLLDFPELTEKDQKLYISYRRFIDYRPKIIGVAEIERYACECANGRRTVGYCSHIAPIIYYLSQARYLSKIVRPAEIRSKFFTQNNMNPVIEEDSDEDSVYIILQ